jgi:hypothetical protein
VSEAIARPRVRSCFACASTSRSMMARCTTTTSHSKPVQSRRELSPPSHSDHFLRKAPSRS